MPAECMSSLQEPGGCLAAQPQLLQPTSCSSQPAISGGAGPLCIPVPSCPPCSWAWATLAPQCPTRSMGRAPGRSGWTKSVAWETKSGWKCVRTRGGASQTAGTRKTWACRAGLSKVRVTEGGAHSAWLGARLRCRQGQLLGAPQAQLMWRHVMPPMWCHVMLNTPNHPAVTARLVDAVAATGRWSGQLELLNRGAWASVCASGFNAAAATVVCKQASCGGLVGGRAQVCSGLRPANLCAGTAQLLEASAQHCRT